MRACGSPRCSTTSSGTTGTPTSRGSRPVAPRGRGRAPSWCCSPRRSRPASPMTPGIGEPEGGPSAQFLLEQAAEHGVWVGGTLPGDRAGAGDDSRPYNSFVLAGPDGTVHRYRKIHPFTYGGEHEQFRRRRRSRRRSRSAACGSRRSSATTCASPTSSGSAPRRPTSTSCRRTGRARAGCTGRRCCRRGRSRTRPTSSAATGSGRRRRHRARRRQPDRRARWASCWPRPRARRRSCWPTSTPAEVTATRDRLRFLPDRRG